ncbi:MAG: hypothetical protein A2W52_01510 [Candidatus Taylorbacteria bacterium RIFCSPHIGHO2_02_49_25]|uniref:Nudix hydrolase domain-containing protein n=2 Tax=Parcubacteria group TaxID=1794811 RepID=A0A1G2MDG1_9BACT|nr:MAG: MutT/Nudix family protein [Candidatus Jorgensenbacteria bacterium GW2011_GWF2_41_8]OHA21937.1 MAG: hypothetical protein A2W52_01510 [Candidatus Taylorbacteria bacterium RIFCSPHIGHO2_02_49_25]OHA35727.1 MAG: hypothetical protein A2W65_02300 [Candidatus Taylorbacteria bacterium RIFCSPLOWO2_02_50_13]OHA42949.1 MAG: hypothetical protein A3H73_02075 [Candidatus Taylorbacteria bacterium RIFCSPLOWO2_02_FULL_50_120]OHA46251.1 MAG: hypothetical protein A3G61_04270 [Candidatus Taylorbacteria bact
MIKKQDKQKLHSIIVNGVIFKGDKVLVSQRSTSESHEPGKWTIPGGKVDRTDGDVFNIIEKTLAREIREETGVEIKDEIQLVTNNTFIRTDGQHVIALIFKCLYKSGKPRPLEDTTDCRWVSLSEVRSMDFPPNVKGYILKSYAKN